VRFHADKRRQAKYAGICAAGGLLGLLVGTASWWVGGPVAVIFFTLTVLLVRSAFTDPAQITVEEEGLGGARLPHPFAWTEITSIVHMTRPARYGTLHFLRITQHGERAFELSLMDLLTPPAGIVAEIEQFHEVE
jgi:hypothetical protein